MLNKEKHRTLMYLILKDIFLSPIWKYVAFKGWTCCYFLHWLDRFSIDLDFDLLTNLKNIEDELIVILKKYWKVLLWNNLILSYWENDVNIKIDLNKNIWKNNIYEFNDLFWITVKTQEKSTIFANKLVALIERQANRDIYDVYFFFQKMFEINEKLIIERTWLTKKELFQNIINKLEKLPKNYKILDGLWEILDEEQKKFVKNKLVTELIWIIKMKIAFE